MELENLIKKYSAKTGLSSDLIKQKLCAYTSLRNLKIDLCGDYLRLHSPHYSYYLDKDDILEKYDVFENYD